MDFRSEAPKSDPSGDHSGKASTEWWNMPAGVPNALRKWIQEKWGIGLQENASLGGPMHESIYTTCSKITFQMFQTKHQDCIVDIHSGFFRGEVPISLYSPITGLKWDIIGKHYMIISIKCNRECYIMKYKIFQYLVWAPFHDEFLKLIYNLLKSCFLYTGFSHPSTSKIFLFS